MYYVIEYDGLRKIMDVKHNMQTELQNQRFPSALADLMKTGDCTVLLYSRGRVAYVQLSMCGWSSLVLGLTC